MQDPDTSHLAGRANRYEAIPSDSPSRTLTQLNDQIGKLVDSLGDQLLRLNAFMIGPPTSVQSKDDKAPPLVYGLVPKHVEFVRKLEGHCKLAQQLLDQFQRAT